MRKIMRKKERVMNMQRKSKWNQSERVMEKENGHLFLIEYSSHFTYALFTYTRPTPRTHYLPILVPLHVRIIYLYSSHSTYALFTWGWDNFSASLTQPFLMQSQNSISIIKINIIVILGFKVSQKKRVSQKCL